MKRLLVYISAPSQQHPELRGVFAFAATLGNTLKSGNQVSKRTNKNEMIGSMEPKNKKARKKYINVIL